MKRPFSWFWAMTKTIPENGLIICYCVCMIVSHALGFDQGSQCDARLNPDDDSRFYRIEFQ
jgi:hypothetical protein